MRNKSLKSNLSILIAVFIVFMSKNSNLELGPLLIWKTPRLKFTLPENNLLKKNNKFVLPQEPFEIVEKSQSRAVIALAVAAPAAALAAPAAALAALSPTEK